MQLLPFQLKDLIEEGKNELELTRESFIQKITHLAVSYFCYSTEIRFILQMKEDPTFNPDEKQKESEFWHAKSLEIACSFLPGECPLLNHINLSYNKHFAPVKGVIKEDEEEEDNLLVIKPMNGIENQRFHPIIKNLEDIEVAITPYQMTPINSMAKPFINQFKSFNEYNEQQKNPQSQNISMQSKMNQSKLNVNRSIGQGLGQKNLECITEDGPVEADSQEMDLKQLESLFMKVQNMYGIDKVKLLKQLLESTQPAKGKGSDGKNRNILSGLNNKD